MKPFTEEENRIIDELLKLMEKENLPPELSLLRMMELFIAETASPFLADAFQVEFGKGVMSGIVYGLLLSVHGPLLAGAMLESISMIKSKDDMELMQRNIDNLAYVYEAAVERGY